MAEPPLSEQRLALRAELGTLAIAALRAGIEACDAGRATTAALRGLIHEPPFAGLRRVDTFACGKAAAAMMRAALVSGLPSGAQIVIAPADCVVEASLLISTHPLPSAASARAADVALALAAEPTDAPLLFLGSGGGSALMGAPPIVPAASGLPEVSVPDLAALTSLLLRSGASIREMNVVRRHVSRIHGGRLARALGERPSVALLVSDVPGDAPSDIGSGPLSPDESTFVGAVEVLRDHACWDPSPASVRAFLEAGVRGEIAETPGRRDLDWSLHRALVIASNATARAAAADALRARDVEPHDAGEVAERDAEDVAEDLVAHALRARMRGGWRAVLGGGEPRVVVTSGTPGGRCQHLAALAARALDRAASGGLLGDCEVVVACLASDGQDGSSDVGGAFVDASTWSRAREAGLDPDALLADCRAREILEAAGALVPAFSIVTNVTDLHAVLVAPAGSRRQARA